MTKLSRCCADMWQSNFCCRLTRMRQGALESSCYTYLLDRWRFGMIWIDLVIFLPFVGTTDIEGTASRTQLWIIWISNDLDRFLSSVSCRPFWCAIPSAHVCTSPCFLWRHLFCHIQVVTPSTTFRGTSLKKPQGASRSLKCSRKFWLY